MKDLVKTIKKISKRHPGYLGDFLPIRLLKYNFLKRGLDREVKADMVNVQSHPQFPHLKIYKYSQDAVCERNWNEITLIARGLIVDTEAKKVIATPFVKFFNYSELIPIAEIMEKEFVALEKLDGSMGICFFYENKWRIATCGSFASEQSQWANKYFAKYIQDRHLEEDTTYLLEIIYPENKIVVPYSKETLCLLSAYRKGYELEKKELDIVAFKSGFSVPETYDFNKLDKILHEASIIDHTQEGFVVRFKSGVRVKIKGDEYCRIHKLISRVTPIAVWEMLVSGDDMESVKKDLPEEMEFDYDNIVSILRAMLQETLDGIDHAYEATKHLSDKELGLDLSNKESEYLKDEIVKQFKSYIFPRRKNTFEEQFNDVDSLMRRKIFKLFRPKSNFLEGYVPSSAMNRFQDGVN
jgi:RNA ligase